ncbi:hypothetical protein FM076_00935 [Streptomyces albus subsp. chlorinus]|uniref:hypothetical protein n=1 Tax=Streptomyces albus TaxID=1888 RepID=UPI0015704927|nr:hypothetical protein [Streptomyces albus]NSC19853.1 hypothetical protein [Streptomyces albus subsp. chlorinus]
MSAPASGGHGVDWHDEAAAERAWTGRDENKYQDPWGLYSARHLMKLQRREAVVLLKRRGYDLPMPPDPSAEWRASRETPNCPPLSDLGGAWLPAELLAALSQVPDDIEQQAWQDAIAEALDTASEMRLLWSTDSF